MEERDRTLAGLNRVTSDLDSQRKKAQKDVSGCLPWPTGLWGVSPPAGRGLGAARADIFSCMVRQVARHREVIASLERKLQEVQEDFDGLHSQVSHALPASSTSTVVVLS